MAPGAELDVVGVAGGGGSPGGAGGVGVGDAEVPAAVGGAADGGGVDVEHVAAGAWAGLGQDGAAEGGGLDPGGDGVVVVAVEHPARGCGPGPLPGAPVYPPVRVSGPVPPSPAV